MKSGSPISREEIELDSTIRNWDRTKETDPYKYGLESLAAVMEKYSEDYRIKTAYNEFCYPTIEEAVGDLVGDGLLKITIVTIMITRGGSHSELEIPEEIEALRSKYKDVDIQYAWPFDIDAFALFLSNHVKLFDSKIDTNEN